MFYRGAWLANVGIAWGGVIWVFAMRSGTLLSDKLFVWFALWGSVLLLYNTWTCALHKYLIWISLNFFVYVKSLNVWWFQVEDIFALVETQYYQWIILLPNKTNPYLQTTCKKKKRLFNIWNANDSLVVTHALCVDPFLTSQMSLGSRCGDPGKPPTQGKTRDGNQIPPKYVWSVDLDRETNTFQIPDLCPESDIPNTQCRWGIGGMPSRPSAGDKARGS